MLAPFRHALRAALHGPDAREALRAMFPQGINLRAAPDAFHLDGDGVIDLPGINEAADPSDDRDLPTVRQPDTIRFP